MKDRNEESERKSLDSNNSGYQQMPIDPMQKYKDPMQYHPCMYCPMMYMCQGCQIMPSYGYYGHYGSHHGSHHGYGHYGWHRDNENR